MDGFQLKKVLDQIVDKAYPDQDDRTRKKLHAFYVKIMEKKYKSKLGDYTYSTHVIRIFDNVNQTPTHLIVTSIHELSHHVDWCFHGYSGHQKPFYDAYRKLLYAGLDLGLFSADEYEKETRVTRDYNRVSRMLKQYRRREGEYKPGMRRIDVLNGFNFRSELKGRGYCFDSVTKCWYKEVPEADTDSEKEWLDIHRLNYELCMPSDFHFQKKAVFPDAWCRHVFSDEEKAALAGGSQITLTDCYSRRTGSSFKCVVKWINGRIEPVNFIRDDR